MLTASAMNAALEHATSGAWPFVFVDLAKVSFMDVAGSRPLRDAIRRCRESRVRLFVVHPSPLVASMLDVLGAGEAIAAIDVRDAADPTSPAADRTAGLVSRT